SRLKDDLQKVRYSAERPNHSNASKMPIEDWLFLKSKDWDYELEWRMIKFLEADDKLMNEDGQPILDVDRQEIYLFPFPPSCVTGVIFGSRMSKEKEPEILNILSENRYSHVKKYRAILDDREFKLNIVSVSEI